MAGDRGRADVDGDAVGPLVEAGPDGDHLVGLVDGDGHAVPAGRERRLELADDVEVGLETGQVPFAFERLEQPGEVAGRRGELGRRHLDVVEADDRIDRERPHVEALADDLAVDLALRRDVDQEIALDRGRARQPPIGGQAVLVAVGRLRAAANGERWSGAEVIPCFGNSPIAGLTWQRPQMPRPPQTESMSTPSERAASRTVVPVGNRPRRPDGVKITSASSRVASASGRLPARW